MPERALIVNVSRGPLLDSAAVADAIRSGRLLGAALDVLDVEPPGAEHPLLGLEGVVMTPHIAYFSERTAAEYVRIQAQNAVTLHESGRPLSPVNSIN
jgi:D-3-phosphoglycerate dehydrogenase